MKISSLLFCCLVGLVGSLFGQASAVGQAFPFTVPGDDATDSPTDRSVLLPNEAGADGFVHVENGHLATDTGRLRLWGVNLCFAANFPTHEQADLVSAHLAKMGVNTVRFHHLDHHAAPNGIWASDLVDGKRVFDPEMVDRLDYFLAALHRRGIYANLNLHVSRTLSSEEGFPETPDMPFWGQSNKWVIYYDRDVQNQWKRFSQEFLLHRNPYRENRRRVDDPGVAVVEMLNEDYFSLKGADLLDRLPDRFQKSFVNLWNQWLQRQYASHQQMIDDWRKQQPPVGEYLIPVNSAADPDGGWIFNQSPEELPREYKDLGKMVLRVAPRQVSEHPYQQQVMYQKLSVEKQQPLELQFWARPDKKRTVQIELSAMQDGQWQSLGLLEDVELGPGWNFVRRVIYPEKTVQGEAYFAINFGQSDVAWEIWGIYLRDGAGPGYVPEEQNLAAGNLSLPDAFWPVAAFDDLQRFLRDTERDTVIDFRDTLRQLGVKVPITGSQVSYHAPEVLDEVDFVDMHSYWHHPVFPSDQPWSATEWTVGNDPLETLPFQQSWPTQSLLMRSNQRRLDRPFTVSEWNYPEPSPFSAGAVPMAAVIAALQDWDGVYFFDYDAFQIWDKEATTPYFRDHATNFFSFNGQPAKLVLLSQMANIFLRSDLQPLERTLQAAAEGDLDSRWGLNYRLGVSSGTPSEMPKGQPQLATPDGSVIWSHAGDDSDLGKGVLLLDTPRTCGAWGLVSAGTFPTDSVTWIFGEVVNDYGGAFLSSVDQFPLGQTEAAVLTLVGQSHNPGMIWNADRTSVGSDWGDGPAQVDVAPVRLQMPVTWRFRTAIALDGTGKPIGNAIPLVLQKEGDREYWELQVGPEQQSLWFLLQAE